jgi:hypothetical protein
MNWTPATPGGISRALFAASPKTEAAFSAPFWCSASPLDAILPGTRVCVANKGLRKIVSSLDATLAKNRGVGVLWLTRNSKRISIPRSVATRDLSGYPTKILVLRRRALFASPDSRGPSGVEESLLESGPDSPPRRCPQW